MSDDPSELESAVPDELLDAEPTPEEIAARESRELEARRYGWKPEAEWYGNKAGWTDVDTFLDLPGTQAKILREENKSLKEELDKRLQGIDRVMQETVKRAREQEAEGWRAKLETARAEQHTAVQEADTDRWKAAKAAEDQLLRQAPVASQDVSQAPLPDWAKNPEAGRYAWHLIQNTPGALAMSHERQLAFAEKHVREQFSDLFPKQEAPVSSAPTFSKVDGGGLQGLKRGRSMSDLPAEARAAFKMAVDSGVKITAEEYAKIYLGDA